MKPKAVSISNEALAPYPYSYQACGVEGVYLLNGTEFLTHDCEEHVAIADVQGLHRAIGRHLVLRHQRLAAAEIRFLRKTMDLTQSERATKLGNDAQSFARWEKGTSEMPGTAEKLLRAVFLAHAFRTARDLQLLRGFLAEGICEDEPLQIRFEWVGRWIVAVS